MSIFVKKGAGEPLTGVEALYEGDAALAGQQVVVEFRGVVAQAADDAHAGDDHAAGGTLAKERRAGVGVGGSSDLHDQPRGGRGGAEARGTHRQPGAACAGERGGVRVRAGRRDRCMGDPSRGRGLPGLHSCLLCPIPMRCWSSAADWGRPSCWSNIFLSASDRLPGEARGLLSAWRRLRWN